MAFADPRKFDHDGDGEPGGSLPKEDPMAARKTDETLEAAVADDLEAMAETSVAPEGGDTVSGAEPADELSEELPPVDSDALAQGLDPNDPAVTGVPRDERHDSIDPVTGALTAEAVELRRQRGSTE